MFDKRTHSVLNYLQSQCPSGIYKILDKKDIVDAMPRKLAIDIESLNVIVEFLEERDYLISKYKDDEQLCMTLTPKAYSALMNDAQYIEKPKFDKKVYFVVIVCAFIGALLGAIVGSLLGF